MALLALNAASCHVYTRETEGGTIPWSTVVAQPTSATRNSFKGAVSSLIAGPPVSWVCARYLMEFLIPDEAVASAKLTAIQASGNLALTDIALRWWLSPALITDAGEFGLAKAGDDLGYLNAQGEKDLAAVWNAHRGEALRIAAFTRLDHEPVTPTGSNTLTITDGYPRIEYTRLYTADAQIQIPSPRVDAECLLVPVAPEPTTSLHPELISGIGMEIN